MATNNIPNSNNYQKVVPFIIFILALFLLFFLIKPMIVVILGSILLAYITYPIYKFIKKKFKRKAISIILALFLVFIVILIPFSFLVFEISKEGYYFYNSLSTNVEKGKLFGFSCDSEDSQTCFLLNRAEKFSSETLSKYGLDKKLKEYLPVLENTIKKFIFSTPIIIAKIFMAFIIAYFILKDWKSILKKVSDLLPMRTKTKNRLIKEFGNITHTVLYAQLFIALVQGILATIGFYIAGVPFPIILGLVLAFFALIPSIGTIIIWAPAAIYLILSGYFSHDYLTMGKGIGLFLYGFFVISTIDNILLAKIVNVKTNINQIVIILGVIGGVAMFGLIGIFIGPILLPLLLTYFETFKERFA